MTSRGTRRLRWLVPAVIAAAIAAASLTTTAAANASDQPKLAPKTAADLLAAVEQADPAGLSGTIVETTKLGLPDLSGIAGAGGSGGDSSLTVESLVTGSHTMNVWYAGPEHQRFALLGQLSESDVIHNGTDLWTYSSTTRIVTHKTLSTKDSTDANSKPSIASAAPSLDPQTAAEQALAAIDPTTTVQVDRTARVAGRAAYQLLLSPKDTRSLIGSVRIAVDAVTFVPLRVQIYAAGATSPAIQVGFTDISFNVPDASVFEFVPPAGATVQENATPFDTASGPGVVRGGIRAAGTGTKATPTSRPQNTVLLGKGWTQVVEISQPDSTGDALSTINRIGGPNSQLLDEASTAVPGGRLITTTLVSILIANDGKIFAGPVSAADIQKVASSGQGL
jgi:outer membrane lipoprotein-sorting protein